MLKLTKKSDYGLIALLHLCGEDNPSATAKEISEAYHIPTSLLSKVLQSLARNGFLFSEQGTKGGYRLARDPHTISALEVIRCIDGPVILTDCFHQDGQCDQMETCTVKTPLRHVHDGILKLLQSITISDMQSGCGPAINDQMLWLIPGPKPAGPQLRDSPRNTRL
jgi:Rrf2 family protein